MGRGQRMEALKEKLADRLTRANEVAVAYINDATPGIYTLNRNYAAYEIESVGSGVDFNLYDESTVKRLIKDQPDLMPYYPAKKALKRGIDLEYGKKQITAAVTSGILQGKSTRKIAADLRERIVNMSVESAIRAARTTTTAAENGGRQATYEKAAEMGIEMTREWLATHDARTRHAHGMADGQRVGVKEPFTVGGEKLMFPGDTSLGASGWNIYNCRCTVATAVKGHERQRETYAEWLERKFREDPEGTPLENTKNSGIISSGAKGALTSKNDPDYSKRNEHAIKYYSSIRNSNRSSIVDAISKNVDIDSKEIGTALDHLFYTKHELEKGFDYFDADYDIAESIQRLRDGRNIQPHDLILIQHEAIEAEYMSSGMTFDEAHNKAQEQYNYALALRVFRRANNFE